MSFIVAAKGKVIGKVNAELDASGVNKLPIVIPYRRVITKNGDLGGFMSINAGQLIVLNAGCCSTRDYAY